jgi:hypothetical protein
MAEKRNRNNLGDIKLSPRLKKKLIRIAVCVVVMLFAYIKAATTSPPKETTTTQTKEHESGWGLVDNDDNQSNTGIGTWIVDTIQGKNEKLAPWDAVFYHRDKSKSDSDNKVYNPDNYDGETVSYSSGSISLGKFTYEGDPYTIVDDNKPSFSKDEYTTDSYEIYSPLDALGRCGPAEACLGKDLMPDSNREPINSIKPSGWLNKKYDTELIDGGFVYNRCHLIAFCLAGENANKYNLITGTRYFNVEGMLPFEVEVADYIKKTGNHVLYKVTPIYTGNNLVADGVQMEAQSVEDDKISFNVFVFNVQPGIDIDYATGETKLAEKEVSGN